MIDYSKPPYAPLVGPPDQLNNLEEGLAGSQQAGNQQIDRKSLFDKLGERIKSRKAAGGQEDSLERKTKRAAIANAIFGGIAGLGDLGVIGAKGIAEGAKPLYGRSQGLYQRLGEQIQQPLRDKQAMDAMKKPTTDKDAYKHKIMEMEHHIPGWEWNKKTKSSVANVGKMRNEVGDINATIDAVRDYTNMFEKHGWEFMASEQGTKMKSIARDIHAKLKSPGIYNLGVLNGKDLEFLEDIVADPNKAATLFKSTKGAVDALRNISNRWEVDLDKKMQAKGYDREGGPTEKLSPLGLKPTEQIRKITKGKYKGQFWVYDTKKNDFVRRYQ